VRISGYLVATIVMLGGSGTLAAPAAAQRPAPACHRIDDFSDSLLAQSRYSLSFAKLGYLFEGSGLDVTDQHRIVPVQSDSLCRIAAQTINRDLQQPDTVSRSIYLLRVGKLYWVVDRTTNVGRFYTVLIVDGTLTRILHRTSGGNSVQ
jgi:hypothetical protein